jgi:hypothetical protein
MAATILTLMATWMRIMDTVVAPCLVISELEIG